MIIVECYPDKALVKSLTTLVSRDVNHEFKGKGAICNELRKQRNCIGLMDEDPSSPQPKYVVRARMKTDLYERFGIRVLQDANGNDIILLCPKLEAWVIKAAEESGKDLRDYDLPNDVQRLHREININLKKFDTLLADLKNSSRLKTLKRLLEKK